MPARKDEREKQHACQMIPVLFSSFPCSVSLISPKIKHVKPSQFPFPFERLLSEKPEEHRRTTMKNKGVSSGPDRHLQCKRRNRTPDNQPPLNTETKTKLRSVVSRSFQERRRVANCAGIDHVTIESIPTPPIAIQIAEHLCSSIPELVDV
jgi:hypothetical protein